MKLVGDRVGYLMQDRSTLVLLIANIAALLAAVYFEWDVFQLMILYWLETAIIGFFSIVKMIHRGKLLAIPLIVFFCFHFGMFMFVHFLFLISLFGDGSFNEPLSANLIIYTLTSNAEFLLLPFLALFGSHLFSFFYNYFGKREYEKRSIAYFFAYPYPRVVIMHITIIVGAFFVLQFGPVFGLILLATLKIFADTIAHLEVHID